ncbi:hypothetical protein AVEN_64713-1 [Araneus ventricosus]|uniref:Uncharacterized protein n=1 Tax=Araneus ventricosus TaxID=182803 RepID=A0A4Y2SQP3_ARAVE|nr:hypothetical protein AVEN_137289-1 [Araneus ventricosus]GBN89499.1 hypothetical protein AVEN_64713-1 [Araneus ventricosus]
MTIRKYLGKESNSQMRSDLNAYRFLLLLAQGQSRIILPRPQIATSTHAHGESDEKEKRQAGVNKYRAQKITSNTHARGNRCAESLEMRLYRLTDSQPFDGFGPKFYTDLHS